MAKARNKNEIEESRRLNLQKKAKTQYEWTIKQIRPYTYITLICAAAALALFLLHFAEIYNTDLPGVEVSFNGFAGAAAFFTRTFTSADAVYGDLAVPFYYYAADYVQRLAAFTGTALALAAAGLILEIVSVVKKAYSWHIIMAVLHGAAGISLVLSFITTLAMNRSDILPVYCSSNPACSIRSYTVIPAVILLAAMAFNLAVYFQHRSAARFLKQSEA